MAKKVTRLPTASKRPVRNPVVLEEGGNVCLLPVITRLPVPPARVLHGAQKAGLSDAVVLGWDQDGEFYFATSISDGGDILWLFALAQQKLLG